MDITRLRTLRELMIRETMAEVADVLCVTPSAVSQHISHLEELTGVQLVERHGRRIRLTHEGKRLAWYAEQAIAVLDEAMAEMAELKGDVSGELRVAAFSSVAAALMPKTMTSLTRQFPRLRIILEELESPEALAALRAWKVDVALVDDLTFGSKEADANIDLKALTQDTLQVVVSKDHRLAAQSTVTVEELRDELWAIDLANHAYSGVVIKACRDAGFEPTINGHSSNLDVLLSLVKGNCSISMLPGLSVAPHRKELHVLKVKPEIRRKIFVASRRTGRRHPAIAALVAQLRATAAQANTRPG
jgi:DNA-binding transcriptional LysR family regulator